MSRGLCTLYAGRGWHDHSGDLSGGAPEAVQILHRGGRTSTGGIQATRPPVIDHCTAV